MIIWFSNLLLILQKQHGNSKIQEIEIERGNTRANRAVSYSQNNKGQHNKFLHDSQSHFFFGLLTMLWMINLDENDPFIQNQQKTIFWSTLPLYQPQNPEPSYSVIIDLLQISSPCFTQMIIRLTIFVFGQSFFLIILLLFYVLPQERCEPVRYCRYFNICGRLYPFFKKIPQSSLTTSVIVIVVFRQTKKRIRLHSGMLSF